MSWASFRATAGFTLLVVTAVVAAFEDFLSTDRIPAYRDLLVFVVPFKHFLASHLQRGELPLWNPWLYMGTPFLASLQSGVFYPLSMLLLLPFPLGFNSFLLAHFVVAAAGFWLLSNSRGLSAPACAVGTLTFALGGYLVSMINLTNHLQAAVWMPWILLCWTRYERLRRFGDLVLFIAVFTIFVLAGAPETVLMMLAVLPAWTLLAAVRPWSERLRLEATLALAVTWAFGLAAFQLMPTAEYIGQSDRSGTLPFVQVATWSLQPISLIQLLLPHSVAPGVEIDPGQQMLEPVKPWIRSIYLGVVPLCLAIGGLAGGREKRFWRVLTIAAVVLALGSATPVLAWLYQVIPFVVGRFRYPEKFYCLVHFAAAVLAADGAERRFRGERQGEGLVRAAAITLFGVVVSLTALRWLAPASYLQLIAVMTGTVAPMTQYVPLAEDLAAKAARASLLLGCFLAALSLRKAGLLSYWILETAVVALVAVDLASIAHGLNRTVSWQALQSQRPMMDVDALRATRQRMFLYQTVSAPFAGQVAQPIVGLEHRLEFQQPAESFEEAARVLWRTMLLDIPMVSQVGTLSGGDGIVRSSDNALRGAVSKTPPDGAVKLLRTFSVARLAGSVPLETSALVLERSEGDPPTFIYRVRDPLPAVYLATRLAHGETPREVFDHIVGEEFTPGVDAIVEELPPGWTQAATPGSPGEVRVVDWHDRRIELRTNGSQPSLLVVNDSYFPGWSARVDGKTVRIQRANFLARGIALTAGDHRVVFLYRPRSLVIGTAISIVAAMAVAFTASVRRRPAAATRSQTS